MHALDLNLPNKNVTRYNKSYNLMRIGRTLGNDEIPLSPPPPIRTGHFAPKYQIRFASRRQYRFV